MIIENGQYDTFDYDAIITITTSHDRQRITALRKLWYEYF